MIVAVSKAHVVQDDDGQREKRRAIDSRAPDTR
jgi:hypothetical protein